MTLYRTILADPPWRYQDGHASTAGAERTKTSAALRYDLMTLDDLMALPASDLAERDAHLWVWGTNMKLDRAYALARAWGFDPITLVTWCKKGPGVGHYLRNNTEHLLLASRGKPQPPQDKQLSTWYEWPRTRHSVKPDASYDLIEAVSPGPYLELFARSKRIGWDAWGNEVDSDVEWGGRMTQEARSAACRHSTTEVRGDKVKCLSCGHSWPDFLIWSSRG